MKEGCVKPRFFDLELYSVYKAVNETLGDKTWDIVWRAGEILLESIYDELGLDRYDDLYEALRTLAKWLIDMGYIDEIDVKKIDDQNLEYIMSKPIIEDGAKKLIDEGMVPPHVSTALFFALLKRYGLKAEMVGNPVFLGVGRVVERWRISKL